ncbi:MULTISPECIES: helix-turn-helix domain-containing protein [unclassified Bacillus (in: firmicutes)]|uniref:helix-turn-helix domain-containing protein n=1 Tax=unclassified Bacillus (in: firmicutes) TaxID=185979 RepID=UPI0020C92029|nr:MULTISPECIES: helix-turn-helix domain-containing protein [unclassified Bacillus (in: firmicutes)]
MTIELDFLDMLIINCLRNLKGERSINAIFHLLKGKKSSQTIQDAHLFGLTSLFQTSEVITKAEIQDVIGRLEKKGWVTSISKEHYVITPVGEIELQKILSIRPLPIHLNGWKYHHITNVFWERLSLLVQVVSNLIYHEQHYFPVQRKRDIHLWLKDLLKSNKDDRDLIGETLYNELSTSLNKDERIIPQALVIRLTGYKSIGLTLGQAAEKLGMDITHYHLEFLNVIHYLIQEVENHRIKYPLLSSLIDTKKVTLTLSTQKTYDMLNAGYSITQIAKFRRLKLSTIEDHVVEIALNVKDFSIDSFVDEELQISIQKVAESISSKQLRYIREKLAHASYFEIRLALAKSGERQWN